MYAYCRIDKHVTIFSHIQGKTLLKMTLSTVQQKYQKFWILINSKYSQRQYFPQLAHYFLPWIFKEQIEANFYYPPNFFFKFHRASRVSLFDIWHTYIRTQACNTTGSMLSIKMSKYTLTSLSYRSIVSGVQEARVFSQKKNVTSFQIINRII